MLICCLIAFIFHSSSAAADTGLGSELADTVSTAQESENPARVPLYELGVGLGSLYAPDYPGADHSSFWVLPIPFFIYRGDVIRSDKEGGTRARWALGPDTEFNLSAGGGLPSSSHTGAREGMPDLQWLGEIGPAITTRLFRTARGTSMKISFPVRAAVSTDLRAASWRGFIFNPYLLFDYPKFFSKDIDAFVSLSGNFATKTYMSYFYTVQPQYATATRAAYDAKGGYLQTTLLAGLFYQIPKWNIQVFGFTSYDTLAGASNHSSPLLKRAGEFTGGFVVAWEFLKSKEQAKIAR